MNQFNYTLIIYRGKDNYISNLLQIILAIFTIVVLHNI